MATNGGLLRVKGTDVVDGNDQRVILKGVRGIANSVYAKLTTRIDSAQQVVI